MAKPDSIYFAVIGLAAPIEACAYYCYMKAIKVSPLSLTLPFLAFTPIFVIITGRVTLGEKLNLMGIVGIILIGAGSYCLNISCIKGGVFAPIRAVLKEQGSLLMLLVSFLYSLTSVLGKIGIQHSNPYFFASTYFIIFTILMTALMPLIPGALLTRITKLSLKSIIIGGVNAVMIFSHMLSISMVEAAYMMSVKRTCLLFGILYGAWWFREKGTGERFLGAVIMLTGVFIIGFFS